MTTSPTRPGFTLIELIIVIAIIAILALMAIPSFVDKVIREQVKESYKLRDFAQAKVLIAYGETGQMPPDNVAAKLPPPEQIVNNVVASVTVNDGAVTVKYGNNAHAGLAGKQLTWRAMVPDDPTVPISSWACNNKPAAEKTTLKGKNLTDIPYPNLPIECRGPVSQ